MGDRYHIEAWSLPLATTALVVARVPFIKASFAPKISASGRGAFTVRKDWDRLSDVTDPDTGTGSLFRIYQEGGPDPVFSFFGRRDARNLADEATDLAVLAGPGIGDVMNYGRVENFDYPVEPITIDPNWSWGAGSTIRGFQNPSFEESEPDGFDVGSGFEDENLAGWKSIPSDPDNEDGPDPEIPGFISVDSPPIVTSADPRTGTFAMEFDPADGADGPSGIKRVIPGWGGEQYTVSLWVKAVSGHRIICGIGPFASASHTNAFTEDDISWAELGNVAEGTGSTNGSYQQFLLDVIVPGPMRSKPGEITVYIAYVDTGDLSVLSIDDVQFFGYGIGLHPWEPGPKDQPQTPTTFHQRGPAGQGPPPPVSPLDGDAVLEVIYTGTGPAGSTQSVEGLTVGRTYSGLANIHHDEGGDRDFLIRFRRGSSGQPYAAATVSVPTGGTWTEIGVTGLAVEEDIFLSVLKVTAGHWWVDKCRIIDGQQSASWGAINIELLDDAAVDHTAETPPFDRDTLGFLGRSFTGLLDSAGNGWSPATVEYRAPRGRKYYQVEVDGSRMGFEWQVADLTATGPRLDIFNPHDWSTRIGGMGINRVGTDVPALRYGPGVVGGPIVRQPSTANRFHIEGEGGQFEVRRDLTSIGNYDTREYYEGDVDFLDAPTIGQVADHTLAERTIPTTALKVQLSPQESDDVPIPFRDFDLGDTYPVDLIGDFTGPKRVVGITADITPGYGVYTVEFDQSTYTTDPLKALTEAVRRLMEQAAAPPAPADLSRPAASVTATVVAPGIVAPDYTVASRDLSRPGIVAVADRVTDQAADELQINSLFNNALPDGWPGTSTSAIQITMAGGRYEGGAPIVFPSGGALVGTGRGTTWITTTAGFELQLSGGCRLGYMVFDN